MYWQFQRGKPRLGGLTVEEPILKKDTRREEQAKRSAETCQRRKADRSWIPDSNEDFFCTSMYEYVPVCMSVNYDFLNFALFEN